MRAGLTTVCGCPASDILTPLAALGVPFEIDDHKGPIIESPISRLDQVPSTILVSPILNLTGLLLEHVCDHELVGMHYTNSCSRTAVCQWGRKMIKNNVLQAGSSRFDLAKVKVNVCRCSSSMS
jgi:hypothetical protein